MCEQRMELQLVSSRSTVHPQPQLSKPTPHPESETASPSVLLSVCVSSCLLTNPPSVSIQQQDSQGATSCPLVFAMQSSALVPLGLSTTVVLRGKNLHVYSVRTAVLAHALFYCVSLLLTLCVCVLRPQDEASYTCVVEIEGIQVELPATVEESRDHTHTFTCSPHQVLPLQCNNVLCRSHLDIINSSVCMFAVPVRRQSAAVFGSCLPASGRQTH